MAAFYEPGVLAVRAGGHDQPVGRFNAPALRHKLSCQPVEQLRVSRRKPGLTKIGWARDQACSEMMLPSPVYNHARRKRMVGLYQPTRQRKPPAACVAAVVWFLDFIRSDGSAENGRWA